MTSTRQPLGLLRRIQRALANPWVKAILALVVLAILVLWLRDQMPFLADGWHAVSKVHWGWLCVALFFGYLSMSSYGSVQKTLLDSAGVKVGYWDSVGLIFASNALATSIPGGQVFSATLTYRRTRQWGATRVIASWQLIISGVLSTIGIVILAIIGFFLVGAVSNPFLLVGSAIALFAVIFGVQWAARHPDRIEGVVMAALHWFNRRRKKPEDTGAEGIHSIIDQADAVDLSRRHLASAFAWSLLNWVADIGCLWASAEAVGAQHSIGGFAIAYVTGKAVASVPVTPGGLGTVELTLIGTLTAGGMAADLALASVFVYRIVSYFLIALAGWVVFFLVYRHATDFDPDVDDPEHADHAEHAEHAGHAGPRGTSHADSVAGGPADASARADDAGGGTGAHLPTGARGELAATESAARWPFKGRTYSPTRNDAARPRGRNTGQGRPEGRTR